MHVESPALNLDVLRDIQKQSIHSLKAHLKVFSRNLAALPPVCLGMINDELDARLTPVVQLSVRQSRDVRIPDDVHRLRVVVDRPCGYARVSSIPRIGAQVIDERRPGRAH
jgi:hypothetical protein